MGNTTPEGNLLCIGDFGSFKHCGPFWGEGRASPSFQEHNLEVERLQSPSLGCSLWNCGYSRTPRSRGLFQALTKGSSVHFSVPTLPSRVLGGGAMPQPLWCQAVSLDLSSPEPRCSLPSPLPHHILARGFSRLFRQSNESRIQSVLWENIARYCQCKAYNS